MAKHDIRGANGKYIDAPKCDCCGKAIDADKMSTDDEVVTDGSDAPGFYICHRVACERKREKMSSVEDRKSHYTAQRVKNERSASA